MAADIKNYLKEKEKRQKNQDDYKKKILKHKLTIVYRVLLVAAALGAALALVVVQAKRHIYTGYDTVSSVNRETSSDAIDVRLKTESLPIVRMVHIVRMQREMWNGIRPMLSRM